MFYPKQISSDIGNYLAGFTDGEGSFNVCFQKRPDYKIGWKVRLTFNICIWNRFSNRRILTPNGPHLRWKITMTDYRYRIVSKSSQSHPENGSRSFHRCPFFCIE